MWVKCNDYNVADTTFTAMKLIEKADYEFRIIAVNTAGKVFSLDMIYFLFQ